MNNYTYENPIIRGYHPDPSVCRVGDDFYLVNSSFEFFPGVPIYHSKDLVNWKRIGSCLTRKSQVNLDNCRPSGGIFAPTLRYHDGIFYMITTNVSDKGNFIVTTDDIYGEWSEPIWIDHGGIDPSLLFDGEHIYYCGTGKDDDGIDGIVVFEINPKTGEILSKKRTVTQGWSKKFAEGPHLYKINGWYYLMVAEGGTEYGHMETIFRSGDVWGPYEACPDNPILSNRNEMHNIIQCTGHADLVNDANGNWWMVCLGIRRLSYAMLHNLGRETFLIPVHWDQSGWLHTGENNTVQLQMDGPLEQAYKNETYHFNDNFSSDTLQPAWTFIRNPQLDHFKAGNGALKITGGTEGMSDYAPDFVGIRQPEFNTRSSVSVSCKLPYTESKAGLSVYYSKHNHYDFYLTKENGILYAVLFRRIMDLETVTAKVCLKDAAEDLTLLIDSSETEYLFRVVHGTKTLTVGSGCTAGLCTEATMSMTFTGVFIGMFAQNTEAEFRKFSMQERVIL